MVQGRRVLEGVARRRAEMTELLGAMVRHETPSLEPSTLGGLFDLVRDALEPAGMVSFRRRGRATGGLMLARPRQRAPAVPVQLLIGHLDTVWPIGTLAQMPVGIEGSRMRGPGIYDMKAGVVHTIYALRVLRELELAPALTPVLLLSSDEEIGSQESRKYIRWLAKAADRTYVMEPSLSPTGKLKTSRKGVVQYRVRVKGVAAHAGLNPDQGVSAILELSLIIQQLFALNDPTQGVSVNVGTIDGGMRPNVIAPESEASIDVRVPTRADARRIDAAIRGLGPSRPEISLTIDEVESRAPMEPTPDSRKLWGAAVRIADELGIELDQGRAGGGSDGNITCEFCPTLDGLGAVGDGAHALHEYVDLDRMIERTALLAMLLLEPPMAQLPEGPP